MKPIYFNNPKREENPEQEVQNFIKKINEKYVGIELDGCNKALLNAEIHEFKEYMKYEYPDYDLTLDLKGDLAYHDAVWTIEEICKAHRLYFSDKHVEKEKYTRIEVNNMLFDLKELSNVLNYYSPVALCTVDGSSYNDEIFEGAVEVECRYYWEDYDKWEEYRHSIPDDVEIEMTLPDEVIKELEPK